MRMTVRFEDGPTANAVLLAAGRDRVRVVVAGRPATEEWLFVYGGLLDEGGRMVEIETAVAVEGIDYSRFAPAPAAMAGGSVD